MSKLVNNQPYKGKIVIHSSVIQEVSKYPNALDAIREYVCNGWDADADRLEIIIDDNFLRIEDWGTGISNFELFWGVADQHKSQVEFTPKFKRKLIGRKGLGKLSFSMLGEKIDVETRTAYKSEYSTADFDKMDYEVYPRSKIDEVLNHKGTQITIRGLKIKLTKDDVINYIKENLYGLILPIASKQHPMRIFVNEEKVTPKPFTGQEGTIATQFGDIHCNLTPVKTTKIDALYRGVKVREVNPAPTHPAKGYFNIDWVSPTPDRSNFTDSPQARLFFLEIKKWVLRNIPSKNEEGPKDLEKSIKELSKLFDQILRDLGMLPQSLMPVSKTLKPSELKVEGETDRDIIESTENVEKEQQEPQQERKRLQHKILKGQERPLRSAFGITYVTRKAGKDKPAIIPFKEEKLIIINQDHDLIKNVNNLRPIQRFVALGFLIARGHFHILESFRNVVSYEEYVDSMVSALFSKMTEVGE